MKVVEQSSVWNHRSDKHRLQFVPLVVVGDLHPPGYPVQELSNVGRAFFSSSASSSISGRRSLTSTDTPLSLQGDCLQGGFGRRAVTFASLSDSTAQWLRIGV